MCTIVYVMYTYIHVTPLRCVHQLHNCATCLHANTHKSISCRTGWNCFARCCNRCTLLCGHWYQTHNKLQIDDFMVAKPKTSLKHVSAPIVHINAHGALEGLYSYAQQLRNMCNNCATFKNIAKHFVETFSTLFCFAILYHEYSLADRSIGSKCTV
jgi:hypothetical protein